VIGGVIFVALSALSYQAYAQFVGPATDYLSLDTATITLGGSSNLDIDTEDMNPGDVSMRVVTLDPDGSGDAGYVNLDVTATASSLLDTDTTNGLQLSIDVCDQAWDETLQSGVPVNYTCAGQQDVALADMPVIGNHQHLGFMDVAPGHHNYLRLSFRLPGSADPSFENLSSTLRLVFELVQRDAGFR
jgi:hypothetical protein